MTTFDCAVTVLEGDKEVIGAKTAKVSVETETEPSRDVELQVECGDTHIVLYLDYRNLVSAVMEAVGSNIKD